jgi:SAM-dependent methyltransferase
MLEAMNVDFGRTASDYGRHRAGFPDSMFDRLTRYGVGIRGQRVVDVGTGTGTVACGFALRGCAVIGIDPSEELIGEARRLDAEAGVDVDHRIARAEDTHLDAGSVDVYAAGQCWHWFDRPRAAAEARRVLVPGGAIVICHFDWLPLPGNVVEATEQLILAHNPRWGAAGGRGMYPAWASDVAEAGFTGIETFSYDRPRALQPRGLAGTDPRQRRRGGVARRGRRSSIRRRPAAMLAERFPGEPLEVPHRVWALIARRP